MNVEIHMSANISFPTYMYMYIYCKQGEIPFVQTILPCLKFAQTDMSYSVSPTDDGDKSGKKPRANISLYTINIFP